MRYLPHLLLGFGVLLGSAHKTDLLATKFTVRDPIAACRKLGREFGSKDITVVTAEYVQYFP